MGKLRFYTTILSLMPYALFALPKAQYMGVHKELFSQEQRYKYVRTICRRVRIHASTITKMYGEENLPAEGGYLMYSNHQGKYDALGIINSHRKPMSVLWEEKSTNNPVARSVAALLDAKIISFAEHKAQVRILNEVAQEVQEGRSFLIFPEGGYTDNHNELQEFKSGCFLCALKSKAPIVPVVIYDSWRSMDTDRWGLVWTQVHYLPPIPYEEYKAYGRKELCELVRTRIDEKLKELRKNDKRLRKIVYG